MTFQHYHEDVMSSARRISGPLTEAQLIRRAPAIFADEAHQSRSDRYAFVPTMPVIRALQQVGYQPYDASAARVRDEARQGFQKHLVRFRHESNTSGAKGGIAELVLINSHDGTSSYRMLAGWFEFLCSNGLMTGTKEAEIRILHKGTQEAVLHDVKDGATAMLDHLQRVHTQREQFLQIELNADEQLAYAKSALETRYEADKVPLAPIQILQPRRREEMAEGRLALPKPDLWSTFNVVQENLVRGGLIGQNANKQYRRQRAVNGIDQNVNLNRALWTLTEEMAKLKA